MKTERPKPKKTSENKALARPEKNKPAQPSPFSPEELAASPWGRLVMFVNDSYSEWVPKNYKNQERQEAIGPIHEKCVKFFKSSDDDWEVILTSKFYKFEHNAAEKNFFHLSRKYSDSPQEVRQQLQANLSQFVELAEYALADSENRNLNKLSELDEVIDYFKKSQERTLFVRTLLGSGAKGPRDA
ncbi:MAG: hypothetical protein GDA38_04935 [Hormoscilla sp. SP12CHS1]|nr:hypothetical protein [Hormoscilla sp. SP12CHS1]